MKKWMVLAAVGAATCLRVSMAAAADYVVSNGGSDGAAGNVTAPFQTLQHAADASVPGDTITAEDGTYAGFVFKYHSGTASQRIVIQARNKGGAKINAPSPTATGDATNDLVQLMSSSFITVDGFEVTAALRAGIMIRTLGDVTGADTTDDIVQNCHSHHNGAGITAGRHDGIFTGFAANVVIQDNESDNNSEHGIYVSNSADNPIMRRNHSHHNTVQGLQINADLSSGGDGLISGWTIDANVVNDNNQNGNGAAINLDGAISGSLTNNLVYGNHAGGITLFQGDGAAASHDNLIANNTVYDGAGQRSAIQIADGANNNIVFNNILYSNSTGLEVQAVTGLVHDYNLVSTYSGDVAGAHEASPAATLLFVDLAGLDFHPGAAALDTGAMVVAGHGAPSADLGGATRPQGPAADIGCFELVVNGPPPPDAGTTVDAGTSSGDAGGTTSDAGTSAGDAGAGGHADGGGVAPDSGHTGNAQGGTGAGGSAPPNGDAPGATQASGNAGGCSVGGGAPNGTFGAGFIALGVLALFGARRARQKARQKDRQSKVRASGSYFHG